MASLKVRMATFGLNIAPVPLSMVEEYRGGKSVWCVDIHIKVYGVTEFDISTEGPTLSAALRAAYLGLNNERGLTDRAAKANAAYGVVV